MDGRGYFSSLMDEGGNNFDWNVVGSQPEFPEQQIREGEAHVRPNQKRSKNFSMEEDILLVSACRIESRPQSGVNAEDKLLQVGVLYKKDDEKERSFQFMHCYKFLKDQPKWIEWRIQKAAAKNSNKKQKINANSTDTAAPTGHQSTIPEERGRKKEKENQRKGSDQSIIDALDHLWAKKKEADAEKERVKAERYKVALALDQQRIDLDKEKFEFK
uniref:No apical meristem-associated C-terminal domain-containing protein n=1 Tax=Oryza punctata TaxID=4537 RepID=A0A0E0MF34_ORYPU